ncbi:SDR family oxidoreductase [Persicobacter diffluens]|uniref:Oxidoreductase n=1 Tax=Persicobacter diffluens TaxID=981 RepID=A0AAN4W293_9BACT|nr:oxidoreductase [Persicobacter diffluens]
MKNVALITGASSGIGKEFARIHAEKGNDLILLARSKDKLEALAHELKNQFETEVIVIQKDLTLANAAQEVFDEIQQANIQITYLINNAGFGGRGYFHERKWEEDLAMINLNIIALTALSRFFLPEFVKRNEGKILNVSSTASLMAGPLQAVYFATKAYVTSFSNALAGELEGTKVTVTALLPGATETEFAKTSGMDKTTLFNQTASARSVAEDGYNAMMAGKLEVLSGLTTMQKIMMASIPITPKKTLLKTIKKMQEVPSS